MNGGRASTPLSSSVHALVPKAQCCPKQNDVESQMKVSAMAAEPPCLSVQEQSRSTARRKGRLTQVLPVGSTHNDPGE